MKANLLVSILCVWSAVTMADDNVIKSYFTMLKETIQSKQPLILEKTVTLNNQISSQISVEICNYVEVTTTVSEKCKGFYILGLLGNDNSIPTLVNNISFYNTDSNKIRGEISMISEFPAQQALISMGIKSVSAIIEKYLYSKESSVRYLCLDTVYKIYLKGFSEANALAFVKFTVNNEIQSKRTLQNKDILINELNNYTPGKRMQ